MARGLWQVRRRWVGQRIGPRPTVPDSSRLGALEQWYAVQPIPRVCGVALEWSTSQPWPELRAALQQVVARHAERLARTLTWGGDDGHYRFAPLQGPMEDCLQVYPAGADLFSVAEHALHTAFSPGTPLFRACATSDGRGLVLVFHHVIADGQGAVNVARDLARALAGANLRPAQAPPALEAVADMRPSVRQVAQQLRAAARPQGFFAGPAHMDASLQTRIFPLVLAAPLAHQLRARARIHGASVHAALCMAALRATRVIGAGSQPLLLSSPISLRARIAHDLTDMGVYIDNYESVHVRPTPDRFWAVAAEYRGQLRQAVQHAPAAISLLNWVRDLRGLANERTRERPNGRTATVEVSNLGVQPWEADTDALWFLQGNHYHGPLLNLSVVTAADLGAIRICLSVPDPLVTPAQVCAYLAELLHTIQWAARS